MSRFYQNARGKPAKKRLIARDGAYHGSGLVSAGLTGMAYCHEGFDLPGDGILRTGRPHYYADAEVGESEGDFSRRRARELDELICKNDPDTIGAFIGEPVMGSGGVIVPPDGYWEVIQNVLQRHDILLIADEIITGFGRTGEWFACEKYNIRPDLITMAKQLTSAYFPLSSVGISDRLYDVIASRAHELGTLGHGFTYGGHPVAAAVALEAIAIYEEMDLTKHVGQRSRWLESGLECIRELPEVGNVRVSGLMAGVEMRARGSEVGVIGRAVGREAERRGVLFRVVEDIIAISPPLIVEEKEIERIVTVLHDSIISIDSHIH